MYRSSLHQPNETSLEYEAHVASHSRPVEHLEFQPLEHDSPRDAVLVSGSGSRSNPFHCHTTSKTFENLMRPDKSLADNLGQSKRKHLFTRAIAVSSDRPNRLPSTNRRFREPQLTRTHQSQTSVTEQSNEMRGRNKKRRVSSGMPSTVPSRIATGLTVAPRWSSRSSQQSEPTEEYEEDNSASLSDSDESASEESSGEFSDSEVSEFTTEPSTVNSSSQSEPISSESESDVESHGSNSDAEDDEAEISNPNASASRIVYVRLPSAPSSEKKAKLQEFLASSYPAAMLILDVQPKRTPVQQRAGLKRLFKFVLSGQVDEVLIANSTQLCNTKEGFEFMEWACQLLGSRVRIEPSLNVF